MVKKILKFKIPLIAVFYIASFVMMFGVFYLPAGFKGYPSVIPEADGLVNARNIAQSGIFGMEDKLNVALAPDLVKTNAHVSGLGNRFTVYSYAYIFKKFGVFDWDQLIILSCFLYALSGIFLMLATQKLWGWRVMMVFPFIYSLLPFNNASVQFLGTYEFASLYFSVFIFLYFWGRDSKFSSYYQVFSGVFLVAACMAREAYLVFLPILFLWLVWNKKIKEILAIFIPIGLILCVFWLPGFIGQGQGNEYLNLFVQKQDTQVAWSDFHYYGHIFSDPYAYYFNHQSIIDKMHADINDSNLSALYRVEEIKVGNNMGLRSVSIVERVFVGSKSLLAHISNFFAIDQVGGPMFFLLVLFGFWRLYKINKKDFEFAVFWLIGTILIISYFVLASRPHLVDYGWIIAGLASLGTVGLHDVLKNYLNLQKYANIFYIIVIFCVLYALALADHGYLSRSYDDDGSLGMKYLASRIDIYPNKIYPSDVLAVGRLNMHPWFNYLSGKSVVYFAPDTVKDLAANGNLRGAFEKFNVKYVIGFDSSTTELIEKNSPAKNLGSWPESKQLFVPVSYTKMWLLNIFK